MIKMHGKNPLFDQLNLDICKFFTPLSDVKTNAFVHLQYFHYVNIYIYIYLLDNRTFVDRTSIARDALMVIRNHYLAM